MKIFWIALAVAGGILLGMAVADAQIAKAQILREDDAVLIHTKWRAYVDAKQEYDNAVNTIVTKYHLDFDPEFSNDFKVAVPKPIRVVGDGSNITLTNQ